MARRAGDSRSRRCATLQQLHALLPGAPGTDRLRRMPVCAAGAGAHPVVVGLQLECDVGVDAHDRGAAVDHGVSQAGADTAARAGNRRAVRERSRPAARGARLGGSPGPTSSWGSTRSSRSSIAGCRRCAAGRRFARPIAGCSTIADDTDGLGAIFPPMVYSIIALVLFGVRPRFARCAMGDGAAGRSADRKETIAFACSPAFRRCGTRRLPRSHWPTRAVPAEHSPTAAQSSGCCPKRCAIPATGRRAAAASSRRAGTSSSITRSTPISTTRPWCCSALQRSPLGGEPAVEAATRRGINWLLSMQNRDGGWAAYDVDIDNQVLTQLPFADHNAMLDPSCADITARVLELLGTLGYKCDDSSVARGSIISGAPRNPRGAGTAGGGSTTSTERGRCFRV